MGRESVRKCDCGNIWPFIVEIFHGLTLFLATCNQKIILLTSKRIVAQTIQK